MRFLPDLICRLRSALRYNLIGLSHRAMPQRQLLYRQHRVKPVYFLSVMTRIKNEARFLPEFIAHHQLLGAEHFYFYNNNSTDQPEAVLKPFIERGLVTVIPWVPVPASPAAEADFFATFASESRWVAFIDADEFIVERRPGRLLHSLRSLAQAPALAISSRYFGSSYYQTIPPGLVTDNFIHSDCLTDHHVKVIAQPDRVKAYYNSHMFIFAGLRSAVDYTGKTVRGTRTAIAQEYELELCHYTYRSKEDYVAKLGIGFVDQDGYRLEARRKDRVSEEFLKHNACLNDWVSQTYSPRIRDYLTQLGYQEPYLLVESRC